jgi:hypothetical protein
MRVVSSLYNRNVSKPIGEHMGGEQSTNSTANDNTVFLHVETAVTRKA